MGKVWAQQEEQLIWLERGHQSCKVEARTPLVLARKLYLAHRGKALLGNCEQLSKFLKMLIFKHPQSFPFICLPIDLGYFVIEGIQFFFFFLLFCTNQFYIGQVTHGLQSSVSNYVSPLTLSHCHLLGFPWYPLVDQLLLCSILQNGLQTGNLWLMCVLLVCFLWLVFSFLFFFFIGKGFLISYQHLNQVLQI